MQGGFFVTCVSIYGDLCWVDQLMIKIVFFFLKFVWDIDFAYNPVSWRLRLNLTSLNMK